MINIQDFDDIRCLQIPFLTLLETQLSRKGHLTTYYFPIVKDLYEMYGFARANVLRRLVTGGFVAVPFFEKYFVFSNVNLNRYYFLIDTI